MLMSVKCSAVVSVALHLTFDDDTVKDRVIGVGDIVDITYNDGGLKKTVEGKVIKVSCATEKETGWYIIVDGSNSMDTNVSKFCPINILDCEIIYKASDIKTVCTPLSEGTIAQIRVNNGQLQYTTDNYNWNDFKLDYSNLLNIPEASTSEDKSNTEDTSTDVSDTKDTTSDNNSESSGSSVTEEDTETIESSN